jgi:RNA polymerase sigma factor (sigma-70 family)
MTNGRLADVIRYLRRTIAPSEGSGVADARLLERFVSTKDEAAFELLVYRHGPMVFGVCQRVLGDVHDAEDAFQATMLALARKAGSIGKWNSVGSWLYKVAYRIALRAKSQATKRFQFEKWLGNALVAESQFEFADDLVWQELRPVLDEALHGLPEKYRVPVVLCYLRPTNGELLAEWHRAAPKNSRPSNGAFSTSEARHRSPEGKTIQVMLLLDPTRPLAPIFVLLAPAVVCAVMPWFRRR